MGGGRGGRSVPIAQRSLWRPGRPTPEKTLCGVRVKRSRRLSLRSWPAGLWPSRALWTSARRTCCRPFARGTATRHHCVYAQVTSRSVVRELILLVACALYFLCHVRLHSCGMVCVRVRGRCWSCVHAGLRVIQPCCDLETKEVVMFCRIMKLAPCALGYAALELAHMLAVQGFLSLVCHAAWRPSEHCELMRRSASPRLWGLLTVKPQRCWQGCRTRFPQQCITSCMLR